MKPVSVKAHTRRPQPSYDPAKHMQLRSNGMTEDAFVRAVCVRALRAAMAELLCEEQARRAEKAAFIERLVA